jgi:membrane complex biogenesis BtpA family protein
MPLPGSPSYDGERKKIYEKALEEVEIYKKYDIDGLLVENYRDKPFYPGKIPAETVASLSAIGKQILEVADMPVGINALRNDAQSGLAIATAIGAHFIRVNVHVGEVMSDQGIIKGMSHKTLRLRARLKSNVMIFADLRVKHATPIVDRGLVEETKDLTERGLADAILITGERTGEEADIEELKTVKESTHLPVLIGSGINIDNIDKYFPVADGFIVGSYFKEGGLAENFIDEERVKALTERLETLRER